MNDAELERIREWDKKCGGDEGTMFGTTVDRRRLLEYVDQLFGDIATLRNRLSLMGSEGGAAAVIADLDDRLAECQRTRERMRAELEARP